MTDPTHPDPDPDQLELISAYVDGEASAAEVARLEGDAGLLARADELAALRERLAAPAAPPGLVDAHVAAALATYDDVDPAASDATSSTVTELATHRGRRLFERIPVLAAAAVLVIVALAGALAARSLGGDDSSVDETASAVASTTAPAEGGAAFDSNTAQESATPAPQGDTVRPAFGTVDDFATFVTEQAVPRAETNAGSASADAAAPTTTLAPAAPPVDPCDAVSVAGVDPAAVEAVVPATVAGRAVTGVVERTPGDQRRLVVVDDATCDVVGDQPL